MPKTDINAAMAANRQAREQYVSRIILIAGKSFYCAGHGIRLDDELGYVVVLDYCNIRHARARGYIVRDDIPIEVPSQIDGVSVTLRSIIE